MAPQFEFTKFRAPQFVWIKFQGPDLDTILAKLKVIHFSTQMSSQSPTWKMTTQIKLDIT